MKIPNLHIVFGTDPVTGSAPADVRELVARVNEAFRPCKPH